MFFLCAKFQCSQKYNCYELYSLSSLVTHTFPGMFIFEAIKFKNRSTCFIGSETMRLCLKVLNPIKHSCSCFKHDLITKGRRYTGHHCTEIGQIFQNDSENPERGLRKLKSKTFIGGAYGPRPLKKVLFLVLTVLKIGH